MSITSKYLNALSVFTPIARRLSINGVQWLQVEQALLVTLCLHFHYQKPIVLQDNTFVSVVYSCDGCIVDDIE